MYAKRRTRVDIDEWTKTKCKEFAYNMQTRQSQTGKPLRIDVVLRIARGEDPQKLLPVKSKITKQRKMQVAEAVANRHLHPRRGEIRLCRFVLDKEFYDGEKRSK